jgi:hypothetical protein
MIDYQLVKTISFYCKYVGLVATAVLGWINLHYKTTHEADGLTLTPAGKVSRGILIASVVITASSAILENTADSKLRKLAEDQGNRSVAAALQAQHQSYINDLKDQIVFTECRTTFLVLSTTLTIVTELFRHRFLAYPLWRRASRADGSTKPPGPCERQGGLSMPQEYVFSPWALRFC